MSANDNWIRRHNEVACTQQMHFGTSEDNLSREVWKSTEVQFHKNILDFEQYKENMMGNYV